MPKYSNLVIVVLMNLWIILRVKFLLSRSIDKKQNVLSSIKSLILNSRFTARFLQKTTERASFIIKLTLINLLAYIYLFRPNFIDTSYVFIFLTSIILISLLNSDASEIFRKLNILCVFVVISLIDIKSSTNLSVVGSVISSVTLLVTYVLFENVELKHSEDMVRSEVNVFLFAIFTCMLLFWDLDISFKIVPLVLGSSLFYSIRAISFKTSTKIAQSVGQKITVILLSLLVLSELVNEYH